MATLVGDRFVRTAGGWLDLVTAHVVDVRVGRAPEDPATRARRCAERLDTLPSEGPHLLDFGAAGAGGWFEARALRVDEPEFATRPPAFSLKRLPRSAVAMIQAIASDPLLRGVRHLRLVAPARSGAHVAIDDAARALRSLGYVTIRADASLPPGLRRDLRHRHLAVLAMTPGARAAAAEWAAQLAATSDRGHLLIERVMEMDDAGGAAGSVVRLEPCQRAELVMAYMPGASSLTQADVHAAAEASDGWPGRFRDELARRHLAPPLSAGAREHAGGLSLPRGGSSWPFSVSLPNGDTTGPRLITRAARCHRRGRAESGDRWLSAGLEARRRRGDAPAILRALEEWVPRLIRAGRARRAAAVATRALADAADPGMRAVVARLAATAHLEAGNLSRAETCVDTAIAIEHITRGQATTDALAVRAAVRLWQGRWRDGRAELDALPPDQLQAASIAKWRELLAWADGDERRQRWMPDGDGSVADDRWPWAVRAFRAAASGIASQLEAALSMPGSVPDSWRVVIAAQAWLDLGDDASAQSEIRRFTLKAVRRRELVDAAAASIRRSLSIADADEVSWLEAVMSRERMRGLLRWGQERSGMQMLHDVSQLLEIVQTCEDETVGLRQVCAWTQTAAAATGCAIVGAPAGDLIAGDAPIASGVERGQVAAWFDRPVAAVEECRGAVCARAPVRYGGATVGFVLGVAAPPRARALFEAVQAAAVVSGAMVRARLDALSTVAASDTLARDILGQSPAIAAVRAMAGRAAVVPFSVVIEGESGTGKELVARALHRMSPRRDRAFAALNCAALADELIEAELFGHARGAFTHAVNARAGMFEEAHQGTLFLDEVGELSPRAQAKLLRVLQEGEIRRVGENESRPVDVRVVAATNRPLAALVGAGRFREDLMFRLSVIRIQVPPLRDRASDVPLLAVAFWRQAARRVGTRAALGPDAIAWLSGLPWPGNVRELQNAMAAIAVSAPAAGRVGARLVRHVLQGLPDGAAVGDSEIVPLEEARRQMERRLVTAALAKHTGSRVAAAHALGLSRQGLSKAIRRLGLAEAGVA